MYKFPHRRKCLTYRMVDLVLLWFSLDVHQFYQCDHGISRVASRVRQKPQLQSPHDLHLANVKAGHTGVAIDLDLLTAPPVEKVVLAPGPDGCRCLLGDGDRFDSPIDGIRKWFRGVFVGKKTGETSKTFLNTNKVLIMIIM